MNTGASTAQRETKSKRLRALAISSMSALLLVLLYTALKPTRDDHLTMGTERVFRLFVSEHMDGSELPVFKATEGDVVIFQIGSTVSGEANLHGYEKKIRLQPGQEVKLSFTADRAGMYPLHLHQKAQLTNGSGELIHRHLAALEIDPR